MSYPASSEILPSPAAGELGALRRAVACARTLLDEVERSIARSAEVSPNGVSHQAAEELMRVAQLLVPSVRGDVLQDAE